MRNISFIPRAGRGLAMAKYGVSCAAMLAACVSPVWAQGADEGAAPAAQGEQAPAEPPGLMDRDSLTGDWGGLRGKLADAGFTPAFKYTGEVFTNPTGGLRQGTVYEHQLLGSLDFDFEKMAGLTGATAHISAISVNDRGPSSRDIGNALDVSNDEWKAQTRLWTAWVQQTGYDGLLSVRVGQLSTDDEFDVSTTAGNLLNSTFGSNASVFANLPAGTPNSQNITLGPAYPLGAPGIRFQITPNENWAWLTGLLSHFPASPDRNGLQFNVHGGALIISELQYLQNQAKDATGLPVAYKVGFWYDTGDFNDQLINTSGGSLAQGGTPRQDHGNYSLYGVADRTVWQDESGKALSLFARINLVPQSDRNLVTFYIDAGAGYKGLIAGRESDVLGFGIAHASAGDDAQNFDRDSGLAVRSGETAIEVNYTAQVAPWWTVTPDLQYIFSPNYGAHNPQSSNGQQTIPDAFVMGVRTVVAF